MYGASLDIPFLRTFPYNEMGSCKSDRKDTSTNILQNKNKQGWKNIPQQANSENI